MSLTTNSGKAQMKKNAKAVAAKAAKAETKTPAKTTKTATREVDDAVC
jgi:hypothetical protein